MTTTQQSPLAQQDKDNLFHPFTSIVEHLETGPLVMARAEGTRVYDEHGREFLDAMAGLWCVNVGYGRPEVIEAITRQVSTLPFYHSFASMSNEPAIRFADAIVKRAPGNMSKVFFCNSGSEANDTHVKLAWYYNNLRGKPEKKKIISRESAFHGVTVAAGSLTGLPHVHKAFDLPIPQVIHVEKPHHYWEADEGMTEAEFSQKLARQLDERIEREGPDTVAAFIAEPVMGAAGVVPPPEGYFPAIAAVLKKHDVLLIADEVICGFGRLGKLFGSDVYDIEPDMVTMAKGLTSGYIPMAAAVISEKVWNVLKEGSSELGVFGHGFTYTGHPVAAAAGLASLGVIEKEGLVDNAANVGAHLQDKLRATFASHPLVGEVRGLGLIAGIELVKDKDAKKPFDPAKGVAKRLSNAALDEGLICRPIGNAVVFAPPLILTVSEADELVDKLSKALDTVTADIA